mgnify:FL=1|jgi:hypothetical protein|tara:strand:- start:183 stop:458 length:276 start_codon:yes stop_codon:yes gene_type:complete
MSKPVFVVRFPGYWTQSQVDSSRSAIHQMKELNEDYHLIILQDNEVHSGTKFECYNSPHEPEKLEEITRLTEVSIERCLRQEEEKLKKEHE